MTRKRILDERVALRALYFLRRVGRQFSNRQPIKYDIMFDVKIIRIVRSTVSVARSNDVGCLVSEAVLYTVCTFIIYNLKISKLNIGRVSIIHVCDDIFTIKCMMSLE